MPDPCAVQLRRAAPVLRLFAAAQPGGEKDAAYHALVRLAAAVNAARGGPSHRPGLVTSPVTPSVLYRQLAQDGYHAPRGLDALAFDARTCAELDRRDSALALGAA